MNLQDLFSSLQIRQFHRDSPVKTSRTKEGRIQGIRTVGRCQDDNTFRTVKSIHLGQQLVQCLLSLIVAADIAVTLFTDRINLIDKYDTRCFFVRLFEQVTHFCGTHTYEHLHELRSGDGEKRYVCLTGYCFCKQGFTGPRRTYQQRSLRHLCTDILIAFRMVQIIYDLCQQLFRFILTCHIRELDTGR